MDNKFNAQKHFDDLHKIGESVAAALMLCEGLSHANGVLMDDQFIAAAAGALRSMAIVFSEAYDIFVDAESDFSKAFDTKNPC